MNKPVVPLGAVPLGFEALGSPVVTRLPRSFPRVEEAPRTVVLRGLEELADHVGAWDDLARHAAEPNPFHEPWFLVAAIGAFGRELDLRFVLIYADAFPGGPPQLCGFFPIERTRGDRGMPLPRLRLWRPPHSHLGTPLLRAGHEDAALAALHDWLEGSEGAAVMEWGVLGGDGPVHAALSRTQALRSLRCWPSRIETRALLRPRTNAGQAPLATKTRKQLRRQERRLAALGTLAYAELTADDDAEAWIADFLTLEGEGWKGRAGTAFGSTHANRTFFIRATSEAMRRGHLAMMALALDGRTIAMRCAFHANEGAFAFRIAYDEAFARYSPGLLLEVEHARRLEAERRCEWMDSCAPPRHFLADRLWPDRRTLVTLIASTGRRGGNAAVRLLAAARWCRLRLTRSA